MSRRQEWLGDLFPLFLLSSMLAFVWDGWNRYTVVVVVVFNYCQMVAGCHRLPPTTPSVSVMLVV
jgi:hypothetical protein